MDEKSAGVLETVVNSTGSDLIMFFVVAAVIAVPVCIFIHNENKRKDKREAERHTELLERERQLMDVIAENSKVQAQLKSTLESFGEKTNVSLFRVHDRIDAIAKEMSVMKDSIRDILKNANDILGLLNKKGG